MKTKEEYIHRHMQWSEDRREYGVPIEAAKLILDEYAEEYAKAAIKHTLEELMRTGFLVGPMLEANEFFLTSFKESLKK